MTTILKIDASYEIVVVRFQLFPRKRKLGSSIVSRIIESMISDTMSIEANVPYKWIYDSSIALEKEDYKVEYFEIRYGQGKINMAAFTSGKSNNSNNRKSNNALKIKKLNDRIRYVKINHSINDDSTSVKL